MEAQENIYYPIFLCLSLLDIYEQNGKEQQLDTADPGRREDESGGSSSNNTSLDVSLSP